MYGVKDPTGKLGDGDQVAGQDATDTAKGDKTYKTGTPSCVKPNT